jgi:cytosine/adenosine deaminase-related metal-dependent hydrolase
MLVNCHTHLELGWAADLCPQPPGEPFTDWIGRLVARNRQRHQTVENPAAQTRAAVEAGIQALLAAGTTHVGDISATGISVEPLLDSGLAGVVYLEVLGLEPAAWQPRLDWAMNLLQQHRPHERHGMRLGLSAHAPYSTHPDLFRLVADYCRREDVPLCIHLAESPAELELLLNGSGPFLELNARLGAPPPPVPGLRPVHYLESLGVLAARPLLVHMIQVTDEELDLVARYGATIAHCPRSNQLLQCGRMPLEKMLARHIPVAFGTDSLASSPSLNVGEEALTALSIHEGKVLAEQIEGMLRNTAVFNEPSFVVTASAGSFGAE